MRVSKTNIAAGFIVLIIIILGALKAFGIISWETFISGYMTALVIAIMCIQVVILQRQTRILELDKTPSISFREFPLEGAEVVDEHKSKYYSICNHTRFPLEAEFKEPEMESIIIPPKDCRKVEYVSDKTSKDKHIIKIKNAYEPELWIEVEYDIKTNSYKLLRKSF